MPRHRPPRIKKKPNDLALYLKVRPQIAASSGGVINWKGKSPLSWAIRRFTSYSHTSSQLFSHGRHLETGGAHAIFVMEANGGGVEARLLSERLMHYSGTAYWYPLMDDFQEYVTGIESFLWAHNGIPYDYEGLFDNALALVSADMERLFCSELSGASIYNVGPPRFKLKGGIPKAVLIDVLRDTVEPDKFRALSLLLRGKALRPGDVANLPIYKPRVRIL